MKMDNNPQISDSIRRLDNWIQRNGWSGWDPYDIKGKGFIIRLASASKNNFLLRSLREMIYEITYCFPLSSRKLFRIKPEVNAKAMGLFASGYLDLYKITKDISFLKKAETCIEWLINNTSENKDGIGWGYSFDWQSNEFVPWGTPNGIVTTAAGTAILEYYNFTGDKKYLDLCTDICRFLVSLPADKINNHFLCFSYTPLFVNHVHNLNLFIADYLIKISRLIKKPEWEELGMKAVNYTISDQNKDGSFDYNGPPEKHLNFIDHYHTGFVLRMLFSIWKQTGNENIRHALVRCYDHYIATFFHEEFIPKLKPDRIYRIDIHSCSESILCLSELSGLFPDALIKAGKVLEWTIDNLQDSGGYFYYGYLKSRFTGIVFKSKIPYIRWGQAWMLKAMSRHLLCKENLHPELPDA